MNRDTPLKKIPHFEVSKTIKFECIENKMVHTCIATGKSFCASGGKNTSTAFFWNAWFPEGGVPTSIMCNLPPCTLRTAKQNKVESAGLPSIRNLLKAAAWPSIGCETLRSTEYSCIAPTTRFC